ncbi:tyrosine-type recombinase/integrase [Cellulomonas fengjieae]|uniref:tyrosine-type recombinase/integrase n=1 Tax=Cellulomonas fengjieae TaxID=2819978 RepID=UPI001AAE8DD5|nr:site-specific integrase [Cellulomonas fengjieae]MBO3102228.1 site-specific integrase [Cellulomonas fengjieae]
MGREPIKPGRWGRISRKEVSPGVWRAQALYRDFAGVLHKVEARAQSGSGAESRLQDRLLRFSTEGTTGGGATIGPDTRMAVVFDQWKTEKRVEGQITPQSLMTYFGVLERDLRPTFGALRVREVTPVAVNRVLMALGGARKFDTARQARNVMSQVMMMCVRYGAVPSNPVRDAVTVRKPRRAEIRTISLEDIALLRKAVREWEERPALPRGRRNITLLPELVDTMLGTGLRIGECLALRVEDLDLAAEVPTLTVTGTIVRAHGELIRQPKPKSDSSRRTITLPTFVVTAIRTALDLGLDGGPDDLVFPSTKASPRSPSRVRDQLHLAQENIGGKVTPHDFRRTVATQVARESTLANATALLGHSDESTTARHYVQRIHVAPDLRVIIDQLVAQASDEALEGPIRRVNGGSGMTKGPTSA